MQLDRWIVFPAERRDLSGTLLPLQVSDSGRPCSPAAGTSLTIGDIGDIGDTGETLKARLERRPLPLAEALDLAAQIATGLAVFHDRGLVHQKVEPANLRISPEERVQMVDPGLAPPLAAPYRSPEQLRGDRLDAATDVWSLGVSLYEMLTGKVPF